VPRDLCQEIQEIAAFLVQKGWAERNAGNFSYRLDSECFDEFRYRTDLEKGIDTGGSVDALLISVGNSKFRDVAKDPLAHCGIVLCEGDKLSFLSTREGVKPTSELSSHLLIHQYLAANSPVKKAVLHSHPTYLIAFSHKYYDYTKERLNELLADIMPEVSFYIPRGTGFVELLTPGSNELAQETIKELANHDVVVWKKHGCLAVAETLWDAVDMMDILDKAALVRMMNSEIGIRN